MRIEQLHLLAYGPFRGLELDLAGPGIHVVFGRNEAGKSTTLRAIRGLLYGIDVRTVDAHVHKPAELRVGGTLLGGDGTRVRVVRRKGIAKGAPNTLLDERGVALDEAVMQKLLRGVSEETFNHAFGLDHETLQLGARALLEGRGDVGGSLFDASVGGGGDARRLLAELTEEAERLYKPRASAPPLNDALRAFADAQKAVREKQSLPEAYVAQQRALDDAQKLRASHVLRRSELAARRAHIERARRRVPLERKRALLVATLTTLGEIARHGARIASLDARLVAYERARDAHREDAATVDVLRDRIAEASRRAGVPAGSKELRLDARTQSRIARYVQERTKFTERVDTARTELARHERELARLRAELVSAESVREPAGAAPRSEPEHAGVALAALSRALESARKLGDLGAQLTTQTSRAARRRADVEARKAALGGFEGTIDSLVVLPIPASASLEALGSRAAELERALARQAERAVEIDAQAHAVEQQLAEASGDFAPPNAADLRAARATRDEAWVALRDARDAAPPRKVLASAISAYERTVRDADVIADRMIVEADRVTTLARLRAQRTTLLQQREAIEIERQKVVAERSALDDEHVRMWEAAGLARGARAFSLAEMRVWIGKHAQIVEAFAAVREAEVDAEETVRILDVAKRELTTALEGAGAASAASAATLPTLMDVATAWLERAEGARRTAAETAKSVVKLEERIGEQRAALVRDEAALAEARQQLSDLVTPLGVPEDAGADEVARCLEALSELFALEDKRAELASRAAAAAAEVSGFDEEAARMAVDLAPDLVGLSARDVAAELAARSRKAQSATEQLADVEAQLGEIEGAAVPEAIVSLVADADAATRAIEEVDAELEQVDADLSREAHSIGRIEAGMDEMRVDSGAAEASAEAQEALSRLRANVERYARAKVAAYLLAREIERYREENQGPMLTKASQLFARLTLGGFTGVRAGYDERDRPALRCIRQGNVDVDVTGLSEGTRDQLYLSLRLASLLRYAEVAEPMPLVLDDLLIQFDDERSRAALEVIAEVSRHMQVLFFTHHARLVDLARSTVPAASLTVHELASPAPVSHAVVAPAE